MQKKRKYSHAIRPEHAQAVADAMRARPERMAHAEAVSKLYDARRENDALKRRISSLEADLAYYAASPDAISHPVKRKSMWGCSECGQLIPLRDGAPRYPRCPYCGVRFSGTWRQERAAIERGEV